MLFVNPLEGLDASRAASAVDSAERRKTALQELERLFLFNLLQEMRKSVPEDTLTGGSERKQFDEMFDDAVAGEMSKSGQLGLARQVEQQIQRAESAKTAKTEEDMLAGLVRQGLSIKEGLKVAVKSL